MLFLLTGDVQIGKTRWLEGLAADLAAHGVDVAGVLAPGRWVPADGESADANGLEKVGIDNVLLPGGERVAFARRRDLARAEGSFDAASQAGRAGLAWHISDAAIRRVNAHLADLAVRPGRAQLLVVDELGRLELERGEGLTAALDALGAGPAAFPHAVAVVRPDLCERAEALLGPAWGDVARIAPDARGHRLVLGALGLADGAKPA
ncbi:MAG: hypothetical protein HFJ75_05370 [Eggerthellaceae bacterium]|nr:hypothetical protein [Eggerthellaceae bacterium]